MFLKPRYPLVSVFGRRNLFLLAWVAWVKDFSRAGEDKRTILRSDHDGKCVDRLGEIGTPTFLNLKLKGGFELFSYMTSRSHLLNGYGVITLIAPVYLNGGFPRLDIFFIRGLPEDRIVSG